MNDKLAFIRDYFEFLSTFDTDQEALMKYWHPKYLQTEYPSLVNADSKQMGWPESIERIGKLGAFLSKQKFEITNAFENGGNLAVEAIWTAEVEKPTAKLKAGQTLRSYTCIVFVIKEDKIFRQRNYDCFDVALA